MSSKKLGIFNYLSKPFVKLVEKYYPDAFIFVIVLSLLTFLFAINLTNASPVETDDFDESILIRETEDATEKSLSILIDLFFILNIYV